MLQYIGKVFPSVEGKSYIHTRIKGKTALLEIGLKSRLQQGQLSSQYQKCLARDRSGRVVLTKKSYGNVIFSQQPLKFLMNGHVFFPFTLLIAMIH